MVVTNANIPYSPKSESERISPINVAWLVGLWWSRKNLFNEPQTFSMGFKSELSSGVLYQSIPFPQDSLEPFYYNAQNCCLVEISEKVNYVQKAQVQLQA